ncbi:MAG: hypothetical protein ACOY2B_06170 [Pseudomonadota bacterium]
MLNTGLKIKIRLPLRIKVFLIAKEENEHAGEWYFLRACDQVLET